MRMEPDEEDIDAAAAAAAKEEEEEEEEEGDDDEGEKKEDLYGFAPIDSSFSAFKLATSAILQPIS